MLITLTSGRRNVFIDWQTANVHIAVLPPMDVKRHWYWTQELLEQASRLWESTRVCLQYPYYSQYWQLFPTQDEWTVMHYIMEVLRPLRDLTLSMTKRHTVTLHHVITVYNYIGWSQGWCYAIFGYEEDSMEGRFVLRHEVSTTDAVQILCWRDSNDRYATDFYTYPHCVPDIPIV